MDKAITDLLHDLSEKKEFREEFISFLKTLLITFQSEGGEDTNFMTSYAAALSTHETVFDHPSMKLVTKVLPTFAEHLTPFIMLLKSLDPKAIDLWVNIIVSRYRGFQEMGGDGIPPFLQFFSTALRDPENKEMPGYFGGLLGAMGGGPRVFAPFMMGGGCHRGGRRGRGRFGHGHGHGCRGGRGGRRGRGFMRGHGMRGGFHGGLGHRHGDKKQLNKEYRADLVTSEITLADRAMLFPGQVVVKTWKLKNVGEKAWPEEGVSLEYVGRPFNPIINGVKFPVKGGVKVGEEVEVSAVITAPLKSGKYGSAWRLTLPDGRRFGQRLRCRVVVFNGTDENEKERKEENENEEGSIFSTVKTSTPKGKGKEKKEKKQLARLEKKQSKLENKKEKLEAKRKKIAEELERISKELAFSGEQKIEDENDEEVGEVVGEPELPMPILDISDDEKPVYKYQVAVDTLLSMGFTNEPLLRSMLDANEGDVQKVINALTA